MTNKLELTKEELRQLTGAPPSEQPLVTASEFSPEQSRTPRAFWTKPGPKFLLVGVLLVPVFALAGFFLFSRGESEGTVQEPAMAPLGTGDKPETQSEELARLREENARLKSGAALDDQVQIEARQRQAQSRSEAAVDTKTKGSESATTTASSSSPSRSTSSPPRPVSHRPASRSIQSAPPPQAIASGTAQRVSRSPSSSSLYPISPSIVSPSLQPTEIGRPTIETEPQKPLQQWQQLARLGSYGSLPTAEPKSELEQNPAVAASTLTNRDTLFAAVPTAQIAPTSAIFANSSQVQTPILADAEAAILQGQPQQALIAGAKASGLLATPIILDDSNSGDTFSSKEADANGGARSASRFTVVLAEPLIDSRERTALPVGTQLLVQVDGVSESGLVRLSATTAVWKEGNKKQELTLPKGMIQVRGEVGAPLIAESYRDWGGEIASLDAGQFLLGAIGRAAELSTRPSTRVQTGDGTTIITEENPAPDLLAGALEGGTKAVLDTITKRNEQAIEKIQNLPDIRFIEAGRVVQVFVNQSMFLPR